MLVGFNAFVGETPNTPPDLLAENAAQLAEFCDFAERKLTPLRKGLLLGTMANSVKGIFTKDGLEFLTWPTETQAYESPTIEDVYERVYYCNQASGLRVTTMSQASPTGGEPLISFKVGVPAPTVAPVLSVVERDDLRDYPASGVTGQFWYASGGVQYQLQGLAPTVISNLRRYSFAIPAATGGTPPGAVPMFALSFVNGAETLTTVTMSLGGGAVRSDTFPGGVEMSFTSSGGTGYIDLLWGIAETRAYNYVMQNTWLEESEPSPPAIISVTYLQDVRVVTTTPSFTDYRPRNATLIYRTFGSNANYVLVDTVMESATSYLDRSFNITDVGRAQASLNWAAPPSGLFGLTRLPASAFAAFSGNTLYMSEPSRPHAWPYSMVFPRNIRGIHMASQALVVTTAEGTYNVVGATPADMQSIPLDVPQAGISHRSMTSIEGAVAFASNDGVVLVTGSQGSLDISQKFFSRRNWRDAYGDVLSTLSLAYHDGFVVATNPTQAKGFLVRMDEAAGTMTRFPETVDATFYLPVQDTLYYSKGDKVYRFNADPAASYTLDWWSKEFVFPKYTSFGVMSIRPSGPTTIRIYREADDADEGPANTLHDTINVTDAGTFRINPGRYRRWSFRVTGSAVVHELIFATTHEELRRV